MRKAIYFIGLVSLAGALIAADHPQVNHPHNGTWELNLNKSKFSPSPPYKNLTRTYEITGDDIKTSAKGIDAEGKPVDLRVTGKFDGKDHPITGSPNSDTISYKRVNASTYDSVQKKKGKVVITGRTTVSKDGKVLTYSTKGTNEKGQAINNIGIYDRQ
jgi:hypothetical protein